jgi:type II secretory pathway component HofQ
VKPRYPALVALSLLALPALAAPASKKPRIRVTRSTASRELPALGYPAIAIGEGPRRYAGEPISLDLKDADLRDVLLTFSKLARLNMVIDPEVRGSVTVRLENVPWDQALEVILKVNGLGYVLEGSIVRVGAPARL